jgi:hypothetical protein
MSCLRQLQEKCKIFPGQLLHFIKAATCCKHRSLLPERRQHTERLCSDRQFLNSDRVTLVMTTVRVFPNFLLFLVFLLPTEDNRWPYYIIMFPVWVVVLVFVYRTAALDTFPTFTKFGMNIIPLKYSYTPPYAFNNFL